MSRKTTWRLFLAHQDRKQEAFLEEQAGRGWHLVRPGLLRFTFERGEAREDRYRLDYQALVGERRAEYLALFADAGWDFLGEVANRYYFRARPEALSPEIHSDPESLRDRVRREIRLLGVILAINAWNSVLLAARFLGSLPRKGHLALDAPADWVLLGTLPLVVAVTVGLGWSIWKLSRGLAAEG